MGGPSTEGERIEQLLLPLLLLAFGAAAGATLVSPPASTAIVSPSTELAPRRPPVVPDALEGYERLTVADVIVAEGAAKSAVLLTGAGQGFVLPLFVTSEVGERIQDRLDSLSFGSPSAFARAIADTGGLVVRVELQNGVDEEPLGRVVISLDGAERPLDATLDEALAVALADGATIWVAQGLVEQRAFQTGALFPLVGNTASHLRAPAVL